MPVGIIKGKCWAVRMDGSKDAGRGRGLCSGELDSNVDGGRELSDGELVDDDEDEKEDLRQTSEPREIRLGNGAIFR